MKIRFGVSDTSLGCKFSVSHTTIFRRLRIGRRLLINDFAGTNVNVVRDRNNLISHSTVLSRHLFSPNNANTVVQIWDATYIFVEKSQNHYHQKRTYNSYKKKELCENHDVRLVRRNDTCGVWIIHSSGK